MKPKYWIISLAVLLIVSNAFWIMQIVDIGITTTYREAGYEYTDKMLDQTIILANMNLIGVDADEAKARIQKGVYGQPLHEKEGCLFAANVCLKLDENRKIISIEEPPQ